MDIQKHQCINYKRCECRIESLDQSCDLKKIGKKIGEKMAIFYFKSFYLGK
jgi:hypothetical protein